ncbi:PTS sugar transporter subunit IIA [Paraburkholderia unamae]|uniref:PTS system ascorbate-specific IIA component n=1 Tax=Paraburkholderia unamae TaxID=219649 RepID=A0ABX5KW33_9BURK|nr:PTS sugar transporter subunit IIA [Paraburkholderia unamae]PVX97797.1 PTS system ascorbate-specific IIA component [Paraburkholderia unamae]
MAGILIIAHAPLATALRECIAHIYGGCPARIGALDVLPDSDPAEVVAKANSEIERLREENGALVLTDMFGATPSNIAARLATVPEVRVLAGVNLPMLVRAVCYRATPLDTLVEKALAGASKGVQTIGPCTPPPAECGCAPTPCAEAVADAASQVASQAANPVASQAASESATSATRGTVGADCAQAGLLRPAGT